jgi:hypothetical protein
MLEEPKLAVSVNASPLGSSVTTAASPTSFRARLEAVALGINMQFPEALNLTEVRAIAKSVSKWTWSRFTPENFSQKQRHRAQTRTRRHLQRPWEAERISRATWYRRRARLQIVYREEAPSE